jgi:hypothetical protein
MPEIIHQNHTNVEAAVVSGELRLSVPVVSEAVAGGAGFINTTTTTTLDLSASRVFLRTMVGDTTLALSNIPAETTSAAAWTLVLRINATGGYTLTGPSPAVVWLDGSTWTNLNMTANAQNVVAFARYGSTTYAWLVSNGVLELDPFVFSFEEDGSQYAVITQAETLSLGSVTHSAPGGGSGSGSLAYARNGSTVTGTQAFTSGQVLTVTRSGSSAAGVVSIPRRLT